MPDPLDALRLPAAPVAPDPAFAARLRTRLEAALADPRPDPPDPDDVPAVRLRGATAVTATEPATTSPLTPYIAVHDAAAALEWYGHVLGAIETTRFVDPSDGRIGHAEVVVGGARLMLSDEYPEIGVRSPRHHEGSSLALHLEVADVDHTYDRALAAGATSQRAPSDQGHGNRNATILDPFGHRWMLSQPIGADRAAAARDDRGVGGDGGEWEVTGRRPVEPGYLTLRTVDLDRARSFYSAVFDWEVEPGSVEGGGHVANTRFPLGLMASEEEPGGAAPTAVTVHFRVDDIEAYAARVEEAGGRVLARHRYPSGGNAECVDDQGFGFHLFQPAPGY